MIGVALRHGLRGLTRFSGRDDRARFWPYVGILLATTMVGAMAGFITIFISTFTKMRRFAEQHPDHATITQGPGSYSISIAGNHPELMPDFGALATVSALIAALFVLLVAAAVARRLHDTGRSGAWGLLPLPFLTVAMTVFPYLMADFGRDAQQASLRLFAVMFANNAIYLGTLAVLVTLLAKRGDFGDNRYGPMPR